MSEHTPSLSAYFGDASSSLASITIKSDDLADKISVLDLEDGQLSSKSEPNVCRLFSKTSPQPKDSTASFFDLIGAPSSLTTAASGMITDIALPPPDNGYATRVAVGSEADRRRDAWIASEKTRQVLIACTTAAPGTYFPERELLTMPGVLLDEEYGDNVGEMVAMCLGETEASQRRAFTANDVTQDERGLRELVQAGAYRAAINLTGRLLKIYGQGRGRAGHPSKHSPHSLQLWFTRIALLVKTKTFQLAQSEAEPFGDLDKPDLYYQFYPEMFGARPGSIASFSFRLLLAELPAHCGKPKESLAKLFSLLATTRQMLANLSDGLCEDGSRVEIASADRADSVRLWRARETRIMHSIINCALAQKDYELTMDLLAQLCDRDGAPKDALLSALGRLHLQLGDVSGAEVCFNEAKQLRPDGGASSFRELVDRGLVAVAQNSFSEAFAFFEQAHAIEPSNVMILNNMGVCLLYTGQLKEAIGVLESAIKANSVQGLHESLLLNLCTLYDMESAKGRMKKFALLRQISRYQADAPAAILEKLYG